MGIKSIFNRFKLPILKRHGQGAGIDISDISCKVLALERKSGKIEVEFFHREEFEPGIIEDGKILDQKKAVGILTEMKEEVEKSSVGFTDVVATVPESKTFLHVFRLPRGVEQEDLRQAIIEKAKNLIPFKPDEVYFDFQFLEEEANLREILYVACPKKIINDYQSVFHKAGFQIGCINIEAASLSRGLISAQDLRKGALIFDSGARTTTLSIFDTKGLRYLNNIKIAGSAFTKAIAEDSGLSREEAESVKRKEGLSEEKILKILDPVLNSLCRQVQSSLEYYSKRYKKNIDKIIICGGSSLMPGLVGYLGEKLGVRVERGRPFERNKIVVPDRFLKDNLIEESLLYAPVLGSALRRIRDQQDFLDINLGI